MVVDGITLEPGGPGNNIDGSVLSLKKGGALDVETGRFAVPTGSSNGTTTLQAFEGGQQPAFSLPGRLLSVVILLCSLHSLM